MTRIVVFCYGAFAYLAAMATIVYMIGFEADFLVPKSIDSPAGAWSTGAAAVNLLLLGLFAVQHTIMARLGFKQWLAGIIPRAAERSTFVLATVAVLGLFFWQWRPIGGVVWEVQQPVLWALLAALSAAGWGIVLYTTFLIDHFALFGLRQSYYYLTDRRMSPPKFQMVSLYKWVRHPLLFGFLIAFWATPTMTVGHLLFSLTITGYALFGIQLEERNLRRDLGAPYLQYRAETPMLIPRPWSTRHAEMPAPTQAASGK